MTTNLNWRRTRNKSLVLDVVRKSSFYKSPGLSACPHVRHKNPADPLRRTDPASKKRAARVPLTDFKPQKG